MKKITLAILLLPLITNAQLNVKKRNVYRNDTLIGRLKSAKRYDERKIELSEIIGVSGDLRSLSEDSHLDFYTTPFKPGICNELSARYHITKNISLGLEYLFNNWTDKNNSFGIKTEFYFKPFYFGIDCLEMNFSPVNTYWYDINYNPSMSVQLHAGFKEKIHGHLYLKQDIAISRCFINYDTRQRISNGLLIYKSGIVQQFNYGSFMVGLSYYL